MSTPIITFPHIRRFAYTNTHLISGDVRGIALSFYGLGTNKMQPDDPEIAVGFARDGILYVIPYNNPWNWMNRAAVAYTDEIVDVLVSHYALGDRAKIVASGRSMGGHSALLYTYRTMRTPLACVANCPVCDLPFHYTEREDLPRFHGAIRAAKSNSRRCRIAKCDTSF